MAARYAAHLVREQVQKCEKSVQRVVADPFCLGQQVREPGRVKVEVPFEYGLDELGLVLKMVEKAILGNAHFDDQLLNCRR